MAARGGFRAPLAAAAGSLRPGPGARHGLSQPGPRQGPSPAGAGRGPGAGSDPGRRWEGTWGTVRPRPGRGEGPRQGPTPAGAGRGPGAGTIPEAERTPLRGGSGGCAAGARPWRLCGVRAAVPSARDWLWCFGLGSRSKPLPRASLVRPQGGGLGTSEQGSTGVSHRKVNIPCSPLSTREKEIAPYKTWLVL